MKRISFKNLEKAHNTSVCENIHIRKAVSRYLGDDGELAVLSVCKALKLVKPRPHYSHKGTFGRLTVIAGSDRYPGAAQLSALSALRCGAGLVCVITTQKAAVSLSASVREATVFPLKSGEDGFIDKDAVLEKFDEIKGILASSDAVLFGCGLGKSDGCRMLRDYVAENVLCPVIFDADGINLVSERIECLRKAKAKVILTPHPMELARLTGSPEACAKNHAKCAVEFAGNYKNVTLVAKSADTVIADRNHAFLSLRGNSGLAKGGSGDMLAGIIASLAAQGYSPLAAAILGVTVQGLCCEAVSLRASKRSMLPSDIINEMPKLFKIIDLFWKG